MLAKIDVATVFRNPRVDSVDAFKLGIQWKDKFYLDIVVLFGWIHGIICTGFFCPSIYSSGYDLHSVESDLKPQINT